MLLQHVCDTLDALRKEVVELFTLLKVVNQKERQLEALKAGEDPTSGEAVSRQAGRQPSTLLVSALHCVLDEADWWFRCVVWWWLLSVLGRGFTGDPTTALKGVVMGGPGAAAALAADPRNAPGSAAAAAAANNKRKGAPVSGGRPPVAALTSPGTSLIGGWGASGELGGSGSSSVSEADKKRLKR